MDFLSPMETTGRVGPGFVRRGMAVNDLPFLADQAKNKGHTARSILNFAVILLRLFPFARDVGGGLAEHLDPQARDIESNVLRPWRRIATTLLLMLSQPWVAVPLLLKIKKLIAL